MKNIKKTVILALTVTLFMSSVACSPSRGSDSGEEKIDTSKTQLYVFNFYGGYGSEWLNAAKKTYEELHKDDVWEEGKKGVQIYINNQKTNMDGISAKILENRDEVYFSEYAYYYTLKKEGVLGDITEAVVGDNTAYGDATGETIESKLTQQQKDYYGIEENGSVHYYGLPHYSGYTGLVYNVELFDKQGYYFVDNPELTGDITDYFIYNSTDKKSAGPDGEYNTDDDGLPSTYEEFYILCRYIAADGNTPIVWTGANYSDYLNNFLQSLVADYEGVDKMSLNYNLSGTADDLGKIENGNFVPDSASTVITSSNGYELSRQAGKYYGLEFMEKIVTTDNFHNSGAFNSAFSHMNAQEDFLYAGHDGVTKPIGMLLDGIWWESEATPTYNEMTDSKGSQFSKTSRNFALMPLPKANAESSGKNTLLDHIYSICCMKSNIEEFKKPLALDFIKFINSDAQLVEYTQITSTPKALNYEMTDEQMSVMSSFGRSVMKLKQNSDVVYPYSSSETYKNHQNLFTSSELYRSIVTGSERQWVANAMHESGATANTYYAGMYSYYSKYWNTIYG